MKKQSSKEISGQEPETKQRVPELKSPIKLRCIRDCDMPGVGLFKTGDTIDDQLSVARISDNPNFEKIVGGKS